MCAHFDEPSLALSDLVHTFTPEPATSSPAPEGINAEPKSQSTTVENPRNGGNHNITGAEPAEPLDIHDIERMRQRVTELGFSLNASLDGGKVEGFTERERELANMVLRLTTPPLPSSAQLLTQAEVIASLKVQRDLLLKEVSDAEERLCAERQGWERTAEALIVQRAKAVAAFNTRSSNAAQESISEKLDPEKAVWEREHRLLQHKLQDTRQRMSQLESELAQLRPILLMQPYALAHSHPTHSLGGLSKPPQMAANLTATAGDTAGNDEAPTPRPRSGYYRAREPTGELVDSKKAGKKSAGDVHSPKKPYEPGKSIKSSRPLLADARSEHLLLAARRIGRHRASKLMASLYKESQPNLQPPSLLPSNPPTGAAPSSGLAHPTTPKTPRRGVAAGAGPGPATMPTAATSTPPRGLHPTSNPGISPFMYPPYFYPAPYMHLTGAPMLTPVKTNTLAAPGTLPHPHPQHPHPQLVPIPGLQRPQHQQQPMHPTFPGSTALAGGSVPPVRVAAGIGAPGSASASSSSMMSSSPQKGNKFMDSLISAAQSILDPPTPAHVTSMTSTTTPQYPQHVQDPARPHSATTSSRLSAFSLPHSLDDPREPSSASPEPPESPLPKRRRLNADSSSFAHAMGMNRQEASSPAPPLAGPSRMRSALDMLADSAASASAGAGEGRSLSTSASAKSKGKQRTVDPFPPLPPSSSGLETTVDGGGRNVDDTDDSSSRVHLHSPTPRWPGVGSLPVSSSSSTGLTPANHGYGQGQVGLVGHDHDRLRGPPLLPPQSHPHPQSQPQIQHSGLEQPHFGSAVPPFGFAWNPAMTMMPFSSPLSMNSGSVVELNDDSFPSGVQPPLSLHSDRPGNNASPPHSDRGR